MSTFDYSTILNNLNFGHLDRRTTSHLRKVYSTLAISLYTCAAGIYFGHSVMSPLIASLAFIGSSLYLAFTSFDKNSESKRLGIMLFAAFSMGVSLIPWVHLVHNIDNSVLFTGFLTSAAVFSSFSIGALATDRVLLSSIIGPLSSMVFLSFGLGLFNLFTRSVFLYTVELYLLLAIESLFIIYDTQIIIYKRSCLGDEDYIMHSFELFLDFVRLMRTVVVVLLKKRKKDED